MQQINCGQKVLIWTKLNQLFLCLWKDFRYILLVASFTQCKQTKKEESKPSEVVDDEILLLQQKLQKVASLPDLNDVLDGLIRWYSSASPKEVHFLCLFHIQQQVLIGDDIIHVLLLRMLQTKNLSVKSTLLMSFFKTVYSLSTVPFMVVFHRIGYK